MKNDRQKKKALESAVKSYAQDKMSDRSYSRENWYEIKDNPISRVGVFDYMGSSLAGARHADGSAFDLEAGKVYKVRRSEEALSDQNFLDSLKLIPWVDDHTMLGDGATAAEDKGISGVTGEDVYFKNGVVYSNLKLFSKSLDTKIDGGKKELSLGYACMYVYKPGVYRGEAYDFDQIALEGNHLASVDKGRMGSKIAVKDNKDSKTTKGILDMDKAEIEGIVASAVDSALEPVKELTALVATLQTAMDESKDMKKEMDMKDDPDYKKKDDDKGGDDKKSTGKDEALTAEVAGLKAELDVIKSKAADSAEGIEKAALYALASPHTGAFDHADMSLASVVDYAIKHESLSVVCDGEDAGIRLATLKGHLSGLGAPKVPTSTAADAKPASSSITDYLKAGN